MTCKNDTIIVESDCVSHSHSYYNTTLSLSLSVSQSLSVCSSLTELDVGKDVQLRYWRYPSTWTLEVGGNQQEGVESFS